MARIAVVGPGSVGVFFAGHLAAAGHEVVACARRPFDRYIIESDEFPLDHPATVVTDPNELDGPAEWVLVCVKAHQTPAIANWLNVLCTPHTNVMVLQNGIEHERVEPYSNGATTIPTVVHCGAELMHPGRIVHRTAGHLMVPAEPHGTDMAELFADSAAGLRPTSNFVTHLWRKLSLNVMANGLTALTGRTLSVLTEPTIRPTAVSLIRECWQVGQAHGADLDPSGADALIDGLTANGRDGGTSMLYDTRAGRPTEHDAIHGAALRAATEVGIDTPTIAVIYGLLEARHGP